MGDCVPILDEALKVGGVFGDAKMNDTTAGWTPAARARPIARVEFIIPPKVSGEAEALRRRGLPADGM